MVGNFLTIYIKVYTNTIFINLTMQAPDNFTTILTIDLLLLIVWPAVTALLAPRIEELFIEIPQRAARNLAPLVLDNPTEPYWWDEARREDI